VDKNGILWTRGFGNADAENNVPAAPNTLYRIGSVSKPLTALVLLRLQEKGLLNIDDPLTKYLPEFSIHDRFGDHKPITLRTLLSHHSGLPSDRLAGMWVDNPVSLRKLTSQIDDESMASAPGTQYRYSNIGYSLVGRVIEVVTNKHYSKVVREELFDPLTMFSSSVSYGKEDLSGLASGYRSGKPCPILTLRDVPAGGVASTVEDMAKVLKILLNSGDEYLRYENIAEVTKPQYDGLPLDFGHKVGLDWNLTGLKLPGVKRIAWHNGAAYPHQAHMAFLPDDGIGVIILSNTMEASRFITDLGRDSLDLVLTAKRGGVPSLEDTSPEPPSLVNLDTNTMEQYAGYYNVLGQIARFKVVNNHMETELWNRTIEMHPISTSTFILRTKAVGVFRVPLNGLRIDFKTVEGYRVAVLTGITSPLVFTKIPEVRIPESWRERLGAYAVETKGESLRFST
jgi:CubicO group peptidase (beta-lactamase class C family)